VTRTEDVLELFHLEPAKPESTSLDPAAQALLERLRDGAMTADELVRASGVEPAAASAALVELELGRRVALEDGVYRASV
jgi:predicted Rossmann fold nucleotide-binding protein DprA/Smf involved in DNA uptake